MLERKINSLSVDTNGYVDCAYRAQLRLLAFNAKIAAMDDERVQILAKKEIITTIYAENVLFSINSAKVICAPCTSADSLNCVEAKKLTCEEIKARFLPKVTEYNSVLLPKYLNNPEYTQLTIHDKTGLELLNATIIIGKDNLDSIGCDLEKI